ncbi:formylglycine-generating enzyme family protein [Engelhardtia mirabilis]|uniref:Serine/threonine-protein kinase pkn1 n=1 Tax=Engelhardtia mirabilis TaxID=2528011 RepID=A0A518BNH0_9BACT|nr:Serine/threonine-protein kinase pkn1 [Planctomycetes bacterium Pla133]QDV02832.1 Serine/threonine-protein kinase pkn1 [Planctomycetes bacterium Pla86]
MTRPFPALGRAAAFGFVSCALATTQAAAFQVMPYGAGLNPPGSLVVTSGLPVVGESFSVGVSNTASASAPASIAFLSLATAPDPAFPAGTVLPGFGLAFPGALGEVLLSLAAPDPFTTLGPVAWDGGAAAPASFDLAVPLDPALSGLTIYLQGSLLQSVGFPSLGLTNGLAVTLSEPSFSGLVPIPAGTFQMGSNAAGGAPYYGSSTEQPVHQVTISQPYWMGRYEVTQAEYQGLMGTNPSGYLGADKPVETVIWFNAVAYCDALNAQQTALGKVPAGYQYRLPTEAEWEYGCRAGTTTEFHYGPALFCNQARFSYSDHSSPPASCQNPLGTVPVGSYAPNAWGLYDMHGNVWEWCMDGFSSYTASAKTDPYVSGGLYRVLRGGSWAFNSTYCRSADRYYVDPGLVHNNYYGFRVVLAPVLVP